MRPVQPPKADTRKPRVKAPPGACDTHLHVYGPFERYPLSAPRSYDPDPHSTIEDYLKVHRALGLERAVIVTGSANGHNNQVTLDAVGRMNGNFKALGLLDPAISDQGLVMLKENYFTGFRVKENGRGGLSFHDAEKMADRVRGFHWHIEFMAESLTAILRSMKWLGSLNMPCVLDHVAYVKPGMTEKHPEFSELLRILKHEADIWVNLYSFYQESETGPPGYEDMVPAVRSIIEARPDRIIWGSNWPHAGIRVPMPDDGDLLDFLLAAAPNEDARNLILADNPAQLYGWDKSHD